MSPPDLIRPEVLAAFSALAFAGSHIAAKRGLKNTSVVAGTTLLLGTALLFATVNVLLNPPDSVALRGVVIIAISGVFAPGIALLASTAGVHRLGPSVSVPIQTGMRPLLSAIGALSLLGETVRPLRVAGILLIVAGTWRLSRAETVASEIGEQPELHDPKSRWNMRPGLIFPLVAALTFSASDLLIKEGLNTLDDPTFGAMVGTGAGFTLWALGSAVVPAVRRRFSIGHNASWFVLAGILVALGILSIYHALKVGDVTVVTPIASSQPLAVLLFSALFLRELERIRLGTGLAAATVVLGTVLLSIRG